MQKANQILQAIRKLSEKDMPLTRVYRSLYCEELYLAAYNKIYRNAGAMTPGTEDDTVDGMNLNRIREIIEALRFERFRFRPSRRIHIPKTNKSGTRPLGIPNFSEKLVQEVLRMLLEAYYEPRFRDSSHGFRPQRGCHTALGHIKHNFTGTVWFIEGDIRGCFDNIDHDVLMTLLARHIHDERLLNLIRLSLKAGVLEDWKYHATYSGTPQGGILSPLLSNIYLHELDVFIEDELIPAYSSGKRRAINLEYERLRQSAKKARKGGDRETADKLDQQRRQLPAGDPNDPNYRRLKYIRYADDFILGFIGTKAEARAIKDALGTFLHDQLHLQLHPEKTLITHARDDHALFLGYTLSTLYRDTVTRRYQTDGTKTRAVNGKIRLGLPPDLVHRQIRRYMRKGKPYHETKLINHSDAHIILTYQQRYRGLAEYYKYAADRHRLWQLKHVMETSLTKTLARKHKRYVTQIYRKYSGRKVVEGRTYKTLEVEVPTKKGSRLVQWGAIPLQVQRPDRMPLQDVPPADMSLFRTDLIQRLQANTCELCGWTGECEVHHIHKLADLKHRWKGRKDKPAWVQRMIALHRKTLVVCCDCHNRIHAGQPIPRLRI